MLLEHQAVIQPPPTVGLRLSRCVEEEGVEVHTWTAQGLVVEVEERLITNCVLFPERILIRLVLVGLQVPRMDPSAAAEVMDRLQHLEEQHLVLEVVGVVAVHLALLEQVIQPAGIPLYWKSKAAEDQEETQTLEDLLHQVVKVFGVQTKDLILARKYLVFLLPAVTVVEVMVQILLFHQVLLRPEATGEL
jgi:hypothetical protein